MNFIILGILCLLLVVSGFEIYLLFYLKKMNSNLVSNFEKTAPIRQYENSEIMNDIIEYTINSGLECMIMPNMEDKTTLYVRGKDGEATPVCIIPQTDSKRGSTGYNALLSTVTSVIKKFKEDSDASN